MHRVAPMPSITCSPCKAYWSLFNALWGLRTQSGKEKINTNRLLIKSNNEEGIAAGSALAMAISRLVSRAAVVASIAPWIATLFL